MTALRRALDALYLGSGIAAALCLIAILVLIVLQMVARWTAEIFPGAPDYVGYCMAAASFLAFAHALDRGAHIRVSIVLNAVGPFWRRVIDTWCFAVATATAWYVVWYACRFVYWSWKFKDISQGQDRTLLWMPQSFVVIGAVILAIALTDNLITLIVTGKHRVRRDVLEQSFGE